MDGIVSCFAVIASLCVSGSATADMHWGAGWTGATIRFRDATVTSTISSDAIILPYVRDMREYCSSETCLFYRGHCGESARQYACVLWYSYERTAPLRKVEIRGSRVSVPMTMASVRLVRSDDVLVPLSLLNYDAPDDSPPACYGRQDCLPEN